MHKRGQVTIFIILGLLVLVLFAISAWYFTTRQTSALESIDKTPMETSPVKLLVESCLKTTVEEALLDNAKHGGYFLLPDHATNDLLDNVPYYFDLGQDRIPANEVLAEQIALYTDTFLSYCLNDISTFQIKGIELNVGKPATDIVIEDGILFLDTNLQVTMRSGDKVAELSRFRIEVDAANYVQNIEIATRIAATQQEDEVCMTCFANLARDNDVFVGILPIRDNVYLFELDNTNHFIGGEELVFRFAVKYDEQ